MIFLHYISSIRQKTQQALMRFQHIEERKGMKKHLAAVLCAAMVTLGLAGCASEFSGESSADSNQGDAPSANSANAISVYSREDSSGTRGAFVELLGIEEKDAAGKKVDKTIPSASITNSTSVMMTSVASDKNAIGYISLGSLNDTVKALAIDKAQPSADNVKSGDYKVARPFNIVTKDDLSDVAQDFVKYILSSDGQKIIEKSGYIAVDDNAEAYQASNKEGKIVVAGSSSITPVMEKLAEAYSALNPHIKVEINQSDSTTGVNMTTEGSCDIGMVSRALKDSEKGVKAITIAQDGIAVIVNKDSHVDELTSAQVKDIYVGNLTTWDDAALAN